MQEITIGTKTYETDGKKVGLKRASGTVKYGKRFVSESNRKKVLEQYTKLLSKETV